MLILEQYIDETFSILDGTLLSCRNSEKRFVIPSEYKGHRIRRIGQGCSIGADTQTLIVSEGIEEIGQDAFAGSTKLELLELPESLNSNGGFHWIGNTYLNKEEASIRLQLRRKFTSAAYESILSESIPLQNGGWLLTGKYYELPQFRDVLNLGWIGPPVLIEREMGRLFLTRKESIEQLIFEGGGPAVCGGDEFPIREYREAKCRMLRVFRAGAPRKYPDNASDLRADRKLQCGEKLTVNTVILITFGRQDVTQREDGVSIDLHIRLGKVFFPDFAEVLYEGQKYYIYREIYLNGVCVNHGSDLPLVRMDLEVFDSSGERCEKSEVLAKYRLLSMLS